MLILTIFVNLVHFSSKGQPKSISSVKKHTRNHSFSKSSKYEENNKKRDFTIDNLTVIKKTCKITGSKICLEDENQVKTFEGPFWEGVWCYKFYLHYQLILI